MKDTERQLLDAISRIIEKEGYSGLGVNKIAKEAGCNKVLIYRYFNGLEGLILEWTKENDFFTNAYSSLIIKIQEADKDVDTRQLVKDVFSTMLQFLRKNDMMKQIFIWELSGNVKFTHIREIREKHGAKLYQLFEEKLNKTIPNLDIHISLIVAGINFLVVQTSHYPHFNGVDFSLENSWVRLEETIHEYIDMLFDKIENEKS